MALGAGSPALEVAALDDTDGRVGRPDTAAAILIMLWLLGGVSSYTMGGFIHLLLGIAIVAVLIRIIQGRRPV